MTTIDSVQRVSPSITEPQHQFVILLKEIINLQWVRETIPVQSKYYDDLKQQQEREIHLKCLLEKQIQEYRKKQDTFTGLLILKRNAIGNNDSNYSELIERLRRCDGKIKEMEPQLRSAEMMVQNLNSIKHTLDTHCLNLHTLYDEVVSATIDDPSHMIERHLKSEVLQLTNDIPQIEKDITSHLSAQKKLYESRDLIEKAMMTLPGATTFLDRQALAGRGTNGSYSLFPKSSSFTSMLDLSVPSFKDAEKLASEAYKLERHASKLCNDIPVIPSSSFNREDNVMTVLTAYRGYRLKVETILRTQLNPRLNKLQSHLAITKYHCEQKTTEWIEQQIIILEDHLRRNGCLRNINLDREISMLRMGSNTAVEAMVGAELNGRMTADNALEVTQSNTIFERNGHLPEYSANACDEYTIQDSSRTTTTNNNNNNNNNSLDTNVMQSPSSPPDSAAPLTITSTSRMYQENTPLSSSSTTSSMTYHLPAYSEHQRLELRSTDAPPAYFR